MFESGPPMNYLNCPTSGVFLQICTLEDGCLNETDPVDNEGLVGISVFMETESMPTSTTGQSAGQAF